MVLDRVAGGVSSRFKPTRSWQRSLAKTFTWRLFATADTFVISALVTGNLRWAGSIVGIEIVTKMMWYFLHERVWAHTRAGVVAIRRDGEEATVSAASLPAGALTGFRRTEYLS
jgi:uncharacterized membrane protein